MNKLTLHQGHVLTVLRSLPAESVHCVVTSPPYFGLRDYGIAVQVWDSGTGVSPVNCEHEWGDGKTIIRDRQHLQELGERLGCGGGNKHSESAEKYNASQGTFCLLCGAWRGSYGMEPTIDLYVQHTVEIFREVRRVLRKDGVLFLNLGDSYCGSGGAGGDYNAGGLRAGQPRYPGRGSKGIRGGSPKHAGGVLEDQPNRYPQPNLKAKDLCGVPWRVALALQADGWWLRSEIIWSKPNPMPESCVDRPSKSHETIFLLTKSANYFWDQEAVREAGSSNSHGGGQDHDARWGTVVWGKGHHSGLMNAKVTGSRNLRTVWEIATQSLGSIKTMKNGILEKYDHFAAFPEKLVAICIKAGTSEHGCCPNCAAPWKRVVEKNGGTTGKDWNIHDRGKNDLIIGASKNKTMDSSYRRETTGWLPTCKCLAPRPSPCPRFSVSPVPMTVPCTILDPFSGAGTTALVAAKLGRDAIGIELKPEYMAMAANRLRQSLGMLASVEIKPPEEPPLLLQKTENRKQKTGF